MGLSAVRGYSRQRSTWWRVGVFFLLAVLLDAGVASAQSTMTSANGRAVSAADAYRAVKSGQTLLIDTREGYEKRSGSPAGVGADVTYLMGGSDDAAFVRRVLTLVDGKRDTDVTLICQAGVRSTAAEHVLEGNGFSKVKTVADGYDGWREQGLPSKPTR